LCFSPIESMPQIFNLEKCLFYLLPKLFKQKPFQKQLSINKSRIEGNLVNESKSNYDNAVVIVFLLHNNNNNNNNASLSESWVIVLNHANGTSVANPQILFGQEVFCCWLAPKNKTSFNSVSGLWHNKLRSIKYFILNRN